MSFYKPFFQFLSTNGDGTGVTNMGATNSDVDYYIEDIAGNDELFVQRIIVHVRDEANGFDTEGFGAIATPLANGIDINYVKANDTVITNLTPLPIKANSDWNKYCYDVFVSSYGTGGTDVALNARWTFSKSNPEGLNLSDGCKLVANCNDDTSALTEFTIMAQGYRLTDTNPRI